MKTSSSSKNRKHSFAKGMLLYAIIFLIIAFIGLSIFWKWAKAYEDSRPSHTINQYINSLTSEHVKDISSDSIEMINTSLQSEDEINEAILEMLKTSKPVKNIALSTDNEQVYLLDYNGNFIEQITLVSGSEGAFGFTTWNVSSEKILIDNLLSGTSVKVPDTWTVKYGGKVLDSSYISDDNIEYGLLEGFYEEGYDLPYMVSYSTGLHLGNEVLVAIDEKGNVINEENLNETFFTNNCTNEEEAALKDFCTDFVNRYVQYTSEGTKYSTYLLFNLLDIVSPGSPLYTQIKETGGGYGYASSLGDTILEIRIPDIMNIGNNSYVCRISFDYETIGSNREVTDSTLNFRLMIKEENGTYKAIAAYWY